MGGHADVLLGMVFSRDGQLLATGSYDGTIRVWDVQAAADHKQFLIDSASDDSEMINFNEIFIDDDGWAIYPNDGGSPLRLMWVPEMHRKSIYWNHPCCVCVMGHNCRKETLLGLGEFVHGKDWVKCMT